MDLETGIRALQSITLQADGDGAIDLAFRLLAQGVEPADLILASARAGVTRYALDSFAPSYGNHGLIAAAAALELQPYLHPDLQRLAAVWAAYHGALGLQGSRELAVAPRLPAADGAAAAGGALLRAVAEQDPAAASGALLALTRTAPAPELARWYFEAACQEIGNLGHKLLVAAHLWHLSTHFPTQDRFAILRPAVHLMTTPALAGGQEGVDFLSQHRQRLAGTGSTSLDGPGAEPSTADLEQFAETVLSGRPLPALAAAIRHGYSGDAVLNGLLLAAARLLAAAGGDRYREGHLLAYCHSARRAWKATRGAAWLPIVQAAQLVARAAARGTPAPLAPAPVNVPELPVRAVFSGQVHALETCAAGLEEAETAPEPVRAAVLTATLKYLQVQSGEAPPVIWRFKQEYAKRA